MFDNYIKIGLRHLRRNGSYLLINVLGLGVALAFAILAFLQNRFSFSFDQWHRDKDRIFRVEVYKATNQVLHGTCPATLAEMAPAEIPQVAAATRLDSRGLTVKQGPSVFNEQVHFADGNFLEMFDFPLAAGEARLADPGTVLLSERAAKKYFGEENPVGKTLLFYADQPEAKILTISGVVRNCPKNSSIQFNFLTHLSNQLEGDKPVVYDSWRWFVDAGFVRLKNAADAPAVEAALQAYVAPQNQGNTDWPVARYRLEALPELALNARNVRWNNLTGGTPPAAIWGNFTLAVMLLLTACFNFANTTIAVGNRRLREMGVRKVMGSTRGQLVRQLLIETLLVCFAALALGVLLAYPMTEWYNATWKHIDLQVRFLDNPPLLIFLAVTVLGTTLLAGAYPAFYISRYDASSIFRGTLRFGGASVFSRLMMGMQIAISLMALVMGFSFARNAQVQRQADLGYSRECLIGVELPDSAAYRTFTDAVRQNPKITALAGTRHHLGFSFRRVDFEYQGRAAESTWMEIGQDYPKLLEMRLASGNGFSPVSETKAGTDVMVNETFVREIGGGQDLVGQVLQFDTARYRVAGIMKDFMIDSPFDPMSPVILHLTPERNYRFCVAKTRPEDLNTVYADLERSWKKLFPYKPYTGFYQSEVLAEALEVSENIATTMFIFSITILLLTVSGLFSVVSLNALKLFRSLAVRRVLGARIGHISYQMNRNYLLVLGGALLLGCFLGRTASLAMMNSIYKIHAGVPAGVLLCASLFMGVVVVLTVGVKVWQIWRMNLTEALKAE